MNNRYVEFHDEKESANQEISKAEAAKEFWRTRDYDPIRGQYYDTEKETTFCNTREEQAKVHGKD